MLDHIVINVSDLDGSRSFYEQALEPLGHGIVLDLSEQAQTDTTSRLCATRLSPPRAQANTVLG